MFNIQKSLGHHKVFTVEWCSLCQMVIRQIFKNGNMIGSRFGRDPKRQPKIVTCSCLYIYILIGNGTEMEDARLMIFD